MAVIGIDLGTTNSLASVWTEEGVKLIPNSFGEYLTPSIVSFGEAGIVYVGKIAKEMLITNPDSTFKEFKRDMGTERTYEIPCGKRYTPQELSAFILRQLKEDAEKYLGEPVEEAIISVPAYFNDNQRCATKDAGKIAGLKVERLINEPSAAALAYHMRKEEEHQTYVVFDIGGGTLDVSVVEAFGNIVEIQAVSGDNHLGGKDFNQVIANYFYKQNGFYLKDVPDKIKAHVYQEAEKCKIALSSQDEVIYDIYIEGEKYELKMSNQKLILLSKDLFQRMSRTLEKALNACDMEIDDIDQIILAGGSSKMPVVRHFIEKILNKPVVCDINPDESIAMGAGMVAGIKQRKGNIKDMILSDICPFSLGTELYDGSFSPIIERNEILPCSRRGYYTTVRDDQSRISTPVYQGESMRARENLLITDMEIEIPPAPAGNVRIEVQYTYDINGILDIDVRCFDNKNEVHKTIVNKNIGLTEAELEEKKRELQELKIHPQEKVENKLLLMKAQHLYEELGHEQRQVLYEECQKFRQVLYSQKEDLIRKAAVRLTLLMEMLKNNREVKLDFENFWNEKIQENKEELSFDTTEKDE